MTYNVIERSIVMTKITVNMKVIEVRRPDIVDDGNLGQYTTSVHIKATDLGRCLSAISECPQLYKTGVIKIFLYRDCKTSHNWDLFHNETQHLKQSHIHKGFSNADIDKQIRLSLNHISQTCIIKNSLRGITNRRFPGKVDIIPAPTSELPHHSWRL